MEVKASSKFIRMSPKKVRLVATLVRGLDVDEAVTQLRFSKKDAAMPISKLIKSAIANAEENDDLKSNNLFVKEIFVDGGPTIKRWFPRAMGRATPKRKRSSHINLVLSERIPTIKKDKKKEDNRDDIINIDDLGKAGSNKKTDSSAKTGKKKDNKDVKSTASSSVKSSSKIFNRTGNK